MTITNRAITTSALANRHSLANVTRTQLTYSIIGISKDRSLVFGALTTGLYQSSDDGGTFTLIHTFPNNVRGIIELSNGEALVLCHGSSSTCYGSSGWSTSKTGATWAATSTGAFAGDYVPTQWSFTQRSAGSNGVIVTNTYGAKTTTGAATLAANIGAGCKVFMSTDFGASFTKIWDILESNNGSNGVPAPNSNGNHVHCAIYDEEWDRIWISYGDAVGNGFLVSGNTKIQLVYSDDRGANWITLNLPTDYTQGAGGGMQFTTIMCTHDAVLLLPDAVPFSVGVFPKIGPRQLGAFRVGPNLVSDTTQGGANSQSNSIIAQAVTQAFGTNMPLFAGMNQFGSGVYQLEKPRILASSNNGQDWYELLSFPKEAAGVTSVNITLYGPTLNGKVIGQHSYRGPSGTWTNGSMIRGDLINPT
jgi:hypothetical protein